ncbi:MAG: hypothetical protein HY926_07775, partial [Elusimicrobia bacterium]|nr:hypothetical protein [Elusimicrobiota bacterium]
MRPIPAGVILPRKGEAGMEHKVSGLGPLAASLIRRAATDWRVVPWVVGGASLLILPAWFAVFREAPQSTLRLPSPRPEAPAPVSAPAVKTGLDGPPVIPEVFARRNPARTAARSGPTRPARPDHGVQTPDEEAASASAPDLPAAGLETPSRRPQFTDALPSRLASSVRSAAAGWLTARLARPVARLQVPRLAVPAVI